MMELISQLGIPQTKVISEHSTLAGDFKATVNAGGKTVTITGLSFTLEVRHIIFGSTIRIDTNGHAVPLPLSKITVSSGVVTFHNADRDFVSTDTVEMVIAGPTHTVNKSLNVDRVFSINEPFAMATDAIPYTTFAPDDTTYDEGTVIDMRKYNTLNFLYSKTVSTADDSLIKAIFLATSDGTVDYQETSLGTPSSGITTISANVYQRDKAALVEMLSIPSRGLPFMRIDVAKATDTGTDSTFTTYIQKAFI